MRAGGDSCPQATVCPHVILKVLRQLVAHALRVLCRQRRVPHRVLRRTWSVVGNQTLERHVGVRACRHVADHILDPRAIRQKRSRLLVQAAGHARVPVNEANALELGKSLHERHVPDPRVPRVLDREVATALHGTSCQERRPASQLVGLLCLWRAEALRLLVAPELPHLPPLVVATRTGEGPARGGLVEPVCLPRLCHAVV